ncbi:addiction module protein [Pedobacter cryophilus]|nr:addiction module protein [Pedobacter cryophilus]
MIEDKTPDWQKEESLKRLEKMKSNPESVISEEDFFRILNKNA